MAGVAAVCGIGVIAGFTLGNRTIMTTDTSTKHLVMIQRCYERQPGSWRYIMTGVTIVSRARMVTRFALCNGVVMTTYASTQHLVMIQWTDKR